MKSSAFGLLCLAAAFSSTDAHAVAKIDIGDKGQLKLLGWGQVRAEMNMVSEYQDAETGETVEGGLDTDLYARRYLLKAAGNVGKVGFGFSTKVLNVGKDGDWGTLGCSDLYVSFIANDNLTFDFGKYLLPFSRHAIESTSALHGLDWHTGVMGYSPDIMLLARGHLANKKLAYRIGVGDGVEPNDFYEAPRLMGRVAFNVFDHEPGFYLSGTYHGSKKVLSFGASYDMQPGMGQKNSLYANFAFDVLADIPIGENVFTASANVYLYDAPGQALADSAKPEGVGMFTEVGYHIRKVEPMVSFELLTPADGDAGKRMAPYAGVNWWIIGHHGHIKAYAGAVNVDGSDTWTPGLILQGGTLF